MVDPGTADEALGILRSGRDQVRRENDRRERAMLGARAVATMLRLGCGDIRSPGLRRTSGVAVRLGIVGWAWWMGDRTKVMGLWSGQGERIRAAAERLKQSREEGAPDPPLKEQVRTAWGAMGPEAKRALALSLGLSVTEWVVVAGFRRSRMRYPHLAAGVVMAAAHTTVGWLRLRKRAADDN
ncbi:hypothetical protein [Tenggerimyces flavus]|uniref:Uncharacterized protein n=1 Tax=Tenggerimyces flavus TaxID=1708749 RepID=A0ABV7YMD8_9ACTN|nr:hypothetical protein [Tenggerimyces flavus]MBM7786253.1 hypothetical protein [Tenggerimyces flavus]